MNMWEEGKCETFPDMGAGLVWVLGDVAGV